MTETTLPAGVARRNTTDTTTRILKSISDAVSFTQIPTVDAALPWRCKSPGSQWYMPLATLLQLFENFFLCFSFSRRTIQFWQVRYSTDSWIWSDDESICFYYNQRKIGEREREEREREREGGEREQWVATIEVYRNYLKALVDEIAKLCQQWSLERTGHDWPPKPITWRIYPRMYPQCIVTALQPWVTH